MNLTGIFKDSFNYAFSDWKKLLIFGVLFVIMALYKFVDGVLASILSIVAIIVFLIVEGYNLSIIRDSIEGSAEVPCLDPKENIVGGLKLFVVELVYGILITIVSLVLILLTVGGTAATGVFNKFNNFTASNPDALAKAVFTDGSVIALMGAVILIICVIAIIFGLFFTISRCRLAKFNRIGEALKLGGVFEDIKTIGVGRFIGWYILLLICVFVISIIAGILYLIPLIGVIISPLIASPIIALVTSRSLGLLYSEI